MFGRTLVQVTPPLRVTWTLPSSVPTQIRPGRRGDSEMVMMVQWVSAPVTSGVIPPVGLAWVILVLSLVVRSGLMIIQWSPRSVDRKRWLPPI